MEKINAKALFFGLLIVVGLYYLLNLMVEGRLTAYESLVRSQQAEQELLLVEIAKTTARNGADSITEKIVKDCSSTDRIEFESLLVKLDSGLKGEDLSNLERLFGRCGNFFSERKSVMVERLKRELAIYESYTSQLSQLQGTSLDEEFQIPAWQELVSLELQQSALFSQLITLQDKIISTLLAGESVESLKIKAILQEVNEVQLKLNTANTQAGSVRTELISL